MLYQALKGCVCILWLHSIEIELNGGLLFVPFHHSNIIKPIFIHFNLSPNLFPIHQCHSLHNHRYLLSGSYQMDDIPLVSSEYAKTRIGISVHPSASDSASLQYNTYHLVLLNERVRRMLYGTSFVFMNQKNPKKKLDRTF